VTEDEMRLPSKSACPLHAELQGAAAGHYSVQA